MIFPKGEIVHQNLSTEYTEVPELLSTLNANGFAGIVEVELSGIKGFFFACQNNIRYKFIIVCDANFPYFRLIKANIFHGYLHIQKTADSFPTATVLSLIPGLNFYYIAAIVFFPQFGFFNFAGGVAGNIIENYFSRSFIARQRFAKSNNIFFFTY